MEIPSLKKFRLKHVDLDTEIKLSICFEILTHQNIEHYLNKKTYHYLERKIKDFVVFTKENSKQKLSLDENFELWIKSEQSNYAFIDQKLIIKQRAKRELNDRVPASVD